MARSLLAPLAGTAPSLHSSLFSNFPLYSHSFPSRTLSSAVHKPSNCYTHYSLTSLHRRLSPVSALDSDVPHPLHQGSADVKDSKRFKQWDSWTAKFSGASNIPFLLLQMPQIILNAQNLMAGNKTALLAVPWLGMFTGLLGNLSLLSYFVKKKETEVIVVQTLGVVSIYIVITQLAMAEAMPLPHFVATSVVVATGLVLNFFNYLGKLNAGIWRVWEDFITVTGLSALPQVMWSTFVPYIPSTILPGAMAFVVAVAAVIMARTGKLSEKGVKFVGGISGWTATLLFMWMPVSQMWTNFLNPDNIKGLSAFSMLLAMIGNGLMVPRALFIRDFMWFTGSSWAALFYGYGNILCMFWNGSVERHCSIWIQLASDILERVGFWLNLKFKAM
ncbi:maltose excess protein 1, chloroplastic isoform X2 [Manihot esculenta]|uniref:maltose excess protein 1, chloroplastic isoform X2 n=1 Tax=Manihot esculenta TaxID=3983 RepID=UPI001CC7AC2D|nr:maltose excess protein 1, chloroplastic isoform X2 [Manihot esculenta]